MSWLTDFWNSYGSLILQALGPHLFMVGVALLLGIVVAVPLGILLTRFPRQASPVIGVISVFQTIPSLVFFAAATVARHRADACADGTFSLFAVAHLAQYLYRCALGGSFVDRRGARPGHD